MVELVGVNDSREVSDGKLLIELKDEVVVEAEGEEVEDVLLVDEVVEAEVDEDEEVIGDEIVKEVVGNELVKEVVEDELVKEVVEDELVKEVVKDELVKEVVEDELVKEVVEDELVKEVVEDELVEDHVVAGGNLKREVIERDGMVEQEDEDKVVEEVRIAAWDVEDVIVFGFYPLFLETEGSSDFKKSKTLLRNVLSVVWIISISEIIFAMVVILSTIIYLDKLYYFILNFIKQ